MYTLGLDPEAWQMTKAVVVPSSTFGAAEEESWYQRHKWLLTAVTVPLGLLAGVGLAKLAVRMSKGMKLPGEPGGKRTLLPF